MQSLPLNSAFVHDLEAKYFLALKEKKRWQDIWELFYSSHWFREKLFHSSKYVVQRCYLGTHYIEDIQQEAMVLIAKSLQRDRSLGYKDHNGNFHGFMSIVIQRCCQKAARQFRRHITQSLQNGFVHPFYEPQPSIESRIDLRQLIRQIPEPYRATVNEVCEGQTIDEIAYRRQRSVRTIYRWFAHAVRLLKLHEYRTRKNANEKDWCYAPNLRTRQDSRD